MRDALNTIWEVIPPPGAGIWGFVRDRALSFGMALLIGSLQLVSSVSSTALAGLGSSIARTVPALAWALQGANPLVSLAVLMRLFALIFKVLSGAQVAWRDVWVGAAITATLFAISTSSIGLYLRKPSIGSPYGAAGSLLIRDISAWISAGTCWRRGCWSSPRHFSPDRRPG